MKIQTYNYILNTLLRVAPFFAGAVLDGAIKKSSHTIESISAGEMLKILKDEVIPKLSKDKEFLTDSLILSNTSTIQTNQYDEILFITGPFESTLNSSPSFLGLYALGLVQKIEETSRTTVRELEIEQSLYRISISPIFDQGQKIIGTLSTITDLSLQREIEDEILHYNNNLRKEIKARVEAENELKENQALLFHSSKLVALGEMASGIAHEINNPLASLRLSIELIKKLLSKDELSNDKLNYQIQAQLSMIDRISNTIVSMKRLSKPSNSQNEFKVISLKQVLNDVLALCEEKFAINDVEIRISKNKKDIQIYSQETQLAQVLVNLLNNSFDEIYDQYITPWIEIDWYRDDTASFITITDCGPGIAHQQAEKIFTPFFSGKSEKGGTGLGLSISSQIMKGHKGHLYIDFDHPNTRFVMSFPNIIGTNQ